MPTLADSYSTVPGLRAALRDAVGHPDQTVLLPDRSVDNACQRALDQLNADRPLVSLGTFATSAGVQTYSPLPSTAYGFRRVYWPLGDGTCSPEFFGQYQSLLAIIDPMMGPVPGAVIDEAGTRTAVEPAMVMEVIRQKSWMRHLTTSGASIRERVVYLDPAPSAVLTVIFTYHAPRYSTVLDVADGDRQRFLDLAEHFLHTRLSVGAGAVDAVDDTNEGTSITTAAAKHHLAQARTSLLAYKRNRPPIPPISSFP